MIALNYIDKKYSFCQFWRLLLIGILSLFIIFPISSFVSVAQAQSSMNASIEGEKIDQFARIIISFDQRFDLPNYKINSENGILTIEFDDPVNIILPDLSETLPQFIIASRIDPDKRGIRFALKTDFRINKAEAGEQLFIDILPLGWQGANPGLPAEIVEKLSLRTKEAIALAAQKQKEKYIEENSPKAVVHVGRHPTFVRLLVDWSIDVEGEYVFEGQNSELKFDWPVPIDLYALQVDLPPEIISVSNDIDVEGSTILLEVEKGVVPRFFINSKKQYVIDIDLIKGHSNEIDITSILSDGDGGENIALNDGRSNNMKDNNTVQIDVTSGKGIVVEPVIEKIGTTIRMVFPFENETAAAVFKRGETLWMVFETLSSIKAPTNLDDFSSLSDNYNVVNGSGTSIVRIGLPPSKLATLGSEGRSWVLSLGDIILKPGAQLKLGKKQTGQGLFEIVVDMVGAANVHQIRDPEVGDVLEVVTAFPPSLSLTRSISFVEFNALRSIHGLVIQPLHENILLRLEGEKAIISSKKGLIVSTDQSARVSNPKDLEGVSRVGFINLKDMIEKNPIRFLSRRNGLAQLASAAGQGERAQMLLNLAQFHLANEYSYEAIGILDVAQSDIASINTSIAMQVTKAAALTLANRSDQALQILNDENVANEMDAMIWRAIAKQKMEDFSGSREDAILGETVIMNYPIWIRNQFFLSSTLAAIEHGDITLAIRYLSQIESAGFSEENLGKYIILSARIDEAQERFDEALDTYGQVLSSDNRPSRAEAVYRTLMLLRKMGRLNSVQASETLAIETLIWRGDRLEAKMLTLLAELQFETGAYREAFENVRQFSKFQVTGEGANELFALAQKEFSELFLDGKAETLEPIKALSLYYDYRYLTPAGAKGDQMIRNLARRLVKVDLLEQSAQLLQYQVDERLEGVAKAQIAADLAVIYLADRSPEKAIKLLNSTRLAGIPASLERQRRVLEGRALIDVGREDLALDILSKVNGKDADLLKIDAQWQAKRYSEAGEIIEQLYIWELEQGNLSKLARDNIVKAAVGYVLGNDIIGLSRLRLKYGEAMATTPEWPLFSFVSSEVNSSSVQFSKLVREIANLDSMNAFLLAYRQNYGSDGALTPSNR